MFAHERYMFLFPVLVLAALLSKETKKKKIVKMLAALAAFAAFLFLRFYLFGQNMWMGTGGASISSSFSVKNALIYALEQVAYLFGWNVGEVYLCGVTVENVSKDILYAAVFMDVCAIGYCLTAVTGTPKQQRPELWKTIALFLMFIAMCIGSSSTTIRVEMRWIYVSFAGMLLLAAALWKTAWRSGGRGRRVALCLLLSGYILSGLYVECGYRPSWHNIYYYGSILEANSFDAVTWQKYEDELFTDIKRIVILDNDQSTWESRKDALSKRLACHTETYDIGTLTIERVNLLEDMPTDSPQQTIYLVRDGLEYIDLTDYYRLLDESSIVMLSGVEPDGWIYQTAELQIRPRNEGVFRFQFYTNATPDETWANRTGRIYVNDELFSSYVMDGQHLVFDISLPFDHSSNVRIENDWTDANIKRGDHELCFVLSVQELE